LTIAPGGRIFSPMLKKKDPAAVKLGRRGGKANMAKLSKEQRSALGKLAAAARWGKRDEKAAAR